MAKLESWSERSASERRRTLGRFGAAYGLVCVVAIALGWVAIAIFFGLGATGFAVVWSQTKESPPQPSRPTPEWMRSIDDPDAPDLSLPEYRERRVAETDGEDKPGGTPPGDAGPTPPPTPTA